MKRTIIKALHQWKDEKSRKPLILRGARQVGKTYILLEFGKTGFPKYHYLNFERDERLGALFEKDLSPARILGELQFYLNTAIDQTRDLVIFDEIQQCPSVSFLLSARKFGLSVYYHCFYTGKELYTPTTTVRELSPQY